MKRILFVAALVMVVAASQCWAGPKAKKDNQGQCVKNCVQAFNKSTADKGDDLDDAAKAAFNFAQKECSRWCKDCYEPGDEFFWLAADDNTGEPCMFGSECTTGNCAFDWLQFKKVCSAPLQ